jgi:hypothetical protein
MAPFKFCQVIGDQGARQGDLCSILQIIELKDETLPEVSRGHPDGIEALNQPETLLYHD